MVQIYSEPSSEMFIGKYIKLEVEENYELTLPEVEKSSADHKLLLDLSETIVNCEIHNQKVTKTFFDRHIHKKVFECDICGEKYTKKNVFYSHMKKNHRELQLRCYRNCKQIFTSRSDLKTHKLQDHSKNDLFCSECTEIFKTTSSLESHIRKNHTKDGKFACNKCNFDAINYQKLFSHKIKNHQKSSKELQCQKCEREFQTLYDFNQHKTMHRFSCGMCEKTFTHEIKKLKHIRDDHEIFTCQKCSKTFDYFESFCLHEKMHKFKNRKGLNKCKKPVRKLS